MARQKKCYSGTTPVNENVYRVNPMRKPNGAVRQSRGGGMTTRKNNPHRYPTQPVVTPISPTYIAATKVKKMKV